MTSILLMLIVKNNEQELWTKIKSVVVGCVLVEDFISSVCLKAVFFTGIGQTQTWNVTSKQASVTEYHWWNQLKTVIVNNAFHLVISFSVFTLFLGIAYINEGMSFEYIYRYIPALFIALSPLALVFFGKQA
ncbi:MAG: hypothetical protein QM504_07045 [Pseudomonadota bacterium]